MSEARDRLARVASRRREAERSDGELSSVMQRHGITRPDTVKVGRNWVMWGRLSSTQKADFVATRMLADDRGWSRDEGGARVTFHLTLTEVPFTLHRRMGRNSRSTPRLSTHPRSSANIPGCYKNLLFCVLRQSPPHHPIAPNP